jgi:MFS family permease
MSARGVNGGAVPRVGGRPARLYTPSLVAICSVALLGFASNFVIQPALPIVVLGQGGNAAIAGFVIGAFSFPSVILRPFMGRLVDEVDRLRVLMVSLLGISVAGAAYLVPSLPLLFANRVFHGVVWAGFNTAGHSTLAELAPPSRRGEAAGVYNLMPGIAQMVMPGVGLVLLGAFGAPAPFLACAALGLAAFAIVGFGPLRGERLTVRSAESRATAPGERGAIEATGPSDRARGLQADRRHGLSASSRTSEGLLERGAIGPMVFELLFSLPFTLFLVFPPVFATLRGIPIADLASYYPVYGGTLVAVRALAGRFLDRASRETVIMLGSTLASLGLAVAAMADSVPILTVGGALYAAAAAFTSPTTMALAIDRADARRLGAAMATYTLGFQLAIGTGATVWGIVIDRLGYPAPYLVAIAVQACLLTYLGGTRGRLQRSGTEP